MEWPSQFFFFCNTLNDIASVVNLLLLKLGKHPFDPHSSVNGEDYIVSIFHSVTWLKKKKTLLAEFPLRPTKIRIVVALGMGVNFADVRYVVK